MTGPFGPLSDLDRAIIFAVRAHAGLLDKSGHPYILHPLRVMDRVRGDETTKIIAVLHDVVEDCAVRLDEIRAEFGAEVADGVDAVSRRGRSGDPDRETYRAFIARAKRHLRGRAVKLADVQDNLGRVDELPEPERSGLARRYIRAARELEEEVTRT